MIISDHEQNTPEWHAARVGLPTASNANLLITSTGARSKSLEGYASKLAADTFAGKDIDAWEGNRFTERGHEIEAEARNWLAFDRDLDIAQVGFCTDNLSRFGASPDGVIHSDNGLVEIKCLPKGHVKSILYWHEKKKPPPEYLQQIHMQMFVTDSDYCLLCYYHPELPKVVIRVDRESKFDIELDTQLSACIDHRDSVLAQLRAIDAGDTNG